MKIVFMGTPDFAVPSLQALLNSNHHVVGVFSQPPRPAGRGYKLTPSPVQQLAEANNIPVFTPAKLTAESVEQLNTLKPDAICVAAYGLILPEAVLAVAPCINVHPSALPRWRGAAPLQWTILSGDKTTDVCIMDMEKGLDTGAVYLRKNYDVGQNETAGMLHNRLAVEGGKLLVEVLNNWPMQPTVQSAEGITYADKIDKLMRPIDFSKQDYEVHNHIRGLSPFPGATAMHNGEVLKLLRSAISPGTGAAGEVLAVGAEGIQIACGNNAIYVTEMQRAGKKAQPCSEFLKGYEINVGDILE